MCFARFNGCAVSRCAVSMASPFLGLAYAELKVNFVEGFAVSMCFARFYVLGSMFKNSTFKGVNASRF
jgi:hypothetical protein